MCKAPWAGRFDLFSSLSVLFGYVCLCSMIVADLFLFVLICRSHIRINYLDKSVIFYHRSANRAQQSGAEWSEVW